MGGNALKNVYVSRININNYNLIKKDIFNKLSFNKFSLSIEFDYLYDVPNKIDFGDLDIIYKANDNINMNNLLIEKFNPHEIIVNGKVTSMSYYLESSNEYYQIDFIKCKNLKMSKFFYSYGDVGGIIGTITKFYGLTFGENLLCNISKETIYENINDIKIILSDDPQQICLYLDFNFNKWNNGFENKELIFDWIISSSWFHKDIFNKSKNSRPFYNEFYDYILNIKNVRDLKKENKQIEALKYFNKLELLDKLIENKIKENERKNKFNGSKIIKYGYNGPDVGLEIIKFRKYINKVKFNNDIDDIHLFNKWLDDNNEFDIDFELYNYLIT
jgi:hypothetical protein